MTCKTLTNCKIYFKQIININKVINSRWFNQFTNLEVNNTDKFPSALSHITFNFRFSGNTDNIPSITHLTFGAKFNKPVNNLPHSITHLTFGWCFNQSVNNLPPITHLTFDFWFNQPVDNFTIIN